MGYISIADRRTLVSIWSQDRKRSQMIAGSQAIAEVCFHMIADDRRTFCDLRSSAIIRKPALNYVTIFLLKLVVPILLYFLKRSLRHFHLRKLFIDTLLFLCIYLFIYCIFQFSLYFVMRFWVLYIEFAHYKIKLLLKLLSTASRLSVWVYRVLLLS